MAWAATVVMLFFRGKGCAGPGMDGRRGHMLGVQMSMRTQHYRRKRAPVARISPNIIASWLHFVVNFRPRYKFNVASITIQ
jgi:hypothetical protein